MSRVPKDQNEIDSKQRVLARILPSSRETAPLDYPKSVTSTSLKFVKALLTSVRGLHLGVSDGSVTNNDFHGCPRE